MAYLVSEAFGMVYYGVYGIWIFGTKYIVVSSQIIRLFFYFFWMNFVQRRPFGILCGKKYASGASDVSDK